MWQRSTMTFIVLWLMLCATPAFASPKIESLEDDKRPDSSWLLVTTEHFAVLSNTDPERAKLIAYKLEQYRYIFSKLTPNLVNRLITTTRVNVFRDGASYGSGLPSINGVVAGYFQPGKDVISINDLFNISDDVSYHEYTHLLTRYDQEYPLWFNEGIAEFFETFEVQGDHVKIGEISTARLQLMRINDFIPLKKLFSYRNYGQILQDGTLDSFYAQSWLLTHYLMTNEARRAKLNNFLKLAQNGISLEAAFKQAFQYDFGRLEDELKSYLGEGNFSVFTLDFDADKVDTDVKIVALTEAESWSKQQEFAPQQFHVTMTSKDDSENACAIIPAFNKLTGLNLKMVASKHPTKYAPSDANMAAKAKEALEVFNVANQLLESGDRDGALAKFEQVIRLDIEFAPAYANIGTIYAQMKSYDMARLAYEKAREVAPNYAGTYVNLAVMQYEQGHPQEAEASFRTALSLYPSSAASHLGLANIYLERRDYGRARIEYTKTINLVRGKGLEAINSYIGLGAVYFYLGDYERAKEQYQHLIKLDPQNGTWHRAYGDNCRLLKQYEQATSAYLRAIELNEQDLKAKESLEWLRKISEYQKNTKQPGSNR